MISAENASSCDLLRIRAISFSLLSLPSEVCLLVSCSDVNSFSTTLHLFSAASLLFAFLRFGGNAALYVPNHSTENTKEINTFLRLVS